MSGLLDLRGNNQWKRAYHPIVIGAALIKYRPGQKRNRKSSSHGIRRICADTRSRRARLAARCAHRPLRYSAGSRRRRKSCSSPATVTLYWTIDNIHALYHLCCLQLVALEEHAGERVGLPYQVALLVAQEAQPIQRVDLRLVGVGDKQRPRGDNINGFRCQTDAYRFNDESGDLNDRQVILETVLDAFVTLIVAGDSCEWRRELARLSPARMLPMRHWQYQRICRSVDNFEM